MRLLLFLLILLTLMSCQRSADEPVPLAANAQATADNLVAPTGQLPKTAIPKHYRLNLTIIPDNERFSGRVSIDIELRKATEAIWLHGKNLTVDTATATQQGHTVTGEYQQIDEDGLAKLTFDQPIAAGGARLELGFSGPYSNLYGLYKVVEDDLAYVLTQMEPIAAREAFPGFDEPAFKTPFDISVTTKTDYEALSNTQATATQPIAGGLKRVTFATTEKLPTYLIAFTVGPVDIVDWEPIPASPVRPHTIPLRGVAAKGKGDQMRYALANTADLLLILEQYFDAPYPYDKLDIVAAPDFAAGAMENPGLILYRESLLLLGDNPGLKQQRSYANVHAHELAHQWFGNLVTMPWWDDIWLNEAFATWMAHKAVHQWQPDYNFDRRTQSRGQWAMGNDALLSARQIRQPVNNADDIENAFDGITYSKGGAVLGMLEGYLGEEAFRQGIRAHMKRHAHGSATVFDLIDSLTKAAPEKNVKAAFESFLFQPGTPNIDVTIDCGDPAESQFTLRQSRYLPHGSKGSATASWTVPVCLSYQVDQQVREQCVLLDQPEQTFAFGSATCPDWVMPNRNGDGYYRWRLESAQTAALSSAMEALNAKEKLAFADSLRAAYDGGGADAAAILQALPALANAEERSVVTALNVPLAEVLHQMLSAENKTKAQQWIRDVFGQRLVELRAGKAESAMEGQLLETTLLGLLAFGGNDPQVRAQLASQARDVLGIGGDGLVNMDAVPPDLLDTAMMVLGEQASDDEYSLMIEHLTSSRSSVLRRALLAGLAETQQASQAEQLIALADTDVLRTNELPWIYFGLAANRQMRDYAWDYLSANVDQILSKLPEDYRGSLARVGGYYCSEDKLSEVKALFEPRIESMLGGPRHLAQAIEKIELCVARMDRHKASANRFFSRS